jgi:soluble lytic murein transglycosylase
LIAKHATLTGLKPELLTAVVRQESGFNPCAVSRAGAMGLMQLMPSTAASEAALERVKGYRISLLTEPDLNVRLGTAHLARRLRDFGGNPALAVAAYNAGPEAVRRWLGQAPGAELDDFVESIPVEQTREYTKRVLRSWAVYRFLYRPEAPAIELPELKGR